MKVPLGRCRKRLAILWFVLGGLSFGLLFAGTVGGRYDEGVDELWQWFLPTIMPSLSLIAGVFVANALKVDPRPLMADRFFFRLAFSLSSAYLLFVLVAVYVQALNGMFPELARRANLGLGPFQGLVCAALGAFFFNSDTSSE